MKKFIVSLVLLVAVALTAAGCQEQVASGGRMYFEEVDPEILASFDQNLSANSNDFGVRVFQELMADKNIFISPTSIYLALAMTYNGASGDTQEAMADVLGIAGVDLEKFNKNNLALIFLLQEADPSVRLNIANSLWLREGIQFDRDFLERNEYFYQALIAELDFSSGQAVKDINRWVSDSTEGMIKEIIADPISPETIMFLINTVYFQGDWSEAFNSRDTRMDVFHNVSGETVEVPFMYRSGMTEYLKKEGEFEAVRLPYGTEERLAMYVFLPDNLEEFVDMFSMEEWSQWQKEFRSLNGVLLLPRFEMEYEQSLTAVLKAMGMAVAFDDNMADFYDMVAWDDNQRVFIGEVKHKSYIKVDEKGTEAAAATSVEIAVTSMPEGQFNLKVDRPFFFMVHDSSTEEILFLGLVNELD